MALTPPRLESGVLKADVLAAGDASGQKVIAYAKSQTGGERRIAVATATPVAKQLSACLNSWVSNSLSDIASL